MLRPYDIETIVLGMVLKYGREAAIGALPDLTPDKFVFGSEGDYGTDYSEIWSAIRDVFLILKQSPTLINVSARLPDYSELLRSLIERLEFQYRITSFNLEDFQTLVELVDKQGVVYNISRIGAGLGSLTEDVETFLHTTRSIEDIDRWTADRLSEMRVVLSARSSGYTHVSAIVDQVKERLERQFRGEELAVLDSGFPSLYFHGLYPVGEMGVIHGLSSSGKSTLMFQILLGTALGLYANDLPGCVALNSLEMSAEKLVQRITSILARVNVAKFRKHEATVDDLQAMFDWADFIAQLPIFIDDTNFLTTSAMEYRASGLHVSQHGPVVQLGSDYGELFKDEAPSEELRVSRVFRQQFFLSRLIGASVIAVSQSTPDAGSNKSYIAGPDGTRYSKSILHAADVVTELWNPVQAKAAGRNVVAPDGLNTAHPWLLLQKYRDDATGVAIPLGWIPETTTFFDMSIDQTRGRETVFTNLELALEKSRGTEAW